MHVPFGAAIILMIIGTVAVAAVVVIVMNHICGAYMGENSH